MPRLRAKRTLFRLRIRWLYTVRPRLAAIGWLGPHLPWTLWCWLCAADAGAVVREIARRTDRPLRFVQIGSSDGVANDPLHETVRAHHWTGVLVEPLPHIFEQLVANYAGTTGVQFANLAIGADEGAITMYTVRPQAGDPYWVEQIASLDREVVRRHAYALPDLDSRIKPVEVQCMPLGAFVDRYQLDAIDLMHTDAEGYDYEIVSQIPLSASWAPRYLVFEAKHLARDRFLSLKARLGRAGYRFVWLGPDWFAYRDTPGRPVRYR